MVIGQLLGLPIAFGSGQLSGAGFGPNYTILMKLGYEFYAPRILDEMQKNPTRSFEDTEYWRAFQKHLKSYTDKVLLQTIDSLAEFPKQTLDALQDKFGEFLNDSYSPAVSTTSGAQLTGGATINVRLDQGLGFLRDPLRQQGGSGFEKDQQALREQEQEKRLAPSKFQSSLRFKSDNDLKKLFETGQYINSKGETVVATTNERNLANLELTRRKALKISNERISQKGLKRPQAITPLRNVKRPAGQSVKKERLSLIRDIATAARLLKSGRVGRPGERNYQVRFNSMKLNQAKLTRLLQQYSF